MGRRRMATPVRIGRRCEAVEMMTMSDTQVAALDHTVQQTNVWLKALGEELHIEDRHVAYNALRAVLHVLRDRLTPEQAVHLGAQLPLLVRGSTMKAGAWRRNQPTNANPLTSRSSWRLRCPRSSDARL